MTALVSLLFIAMKPVDYKITIFFLTLVCLLFLVRPQKINYVFLVPCLVNFLLSGCTITRSNIVENVSNLFRFTACMLCKYSTLMSKCNYFQYQVLQCVCPFLSCSYVKLSVLDQSKKKAWSPGQFWALGRTRNIKFTLRGLTTIILVSSQMPLQKK